MRFLIIFIFLLTHSYADDISSIKNIVINKELKKYDSVTFLDDKKNLLNLKDYQGSLVLLNFWASWCAPCKIEHPVLMKLSQTKNLIIFGINFKDKNTQAKIFLNELGNPYDLLAKDENGKQSVRFGIYGIPESILINKELTIIQKFVGPLSVDDYNTIIKIVE